MAAQGAALGTPQTTDCMSWSGHRVSARRNERERFHEIGSRMFDFRRDREGFFRVDMALLG